MTTLEKIREEIDMRFKEAKVHNTRFYYDVLEIIDKYASEECDRDCEHCAYIECPKDDYQTDMDEAWKQAKQEPKSCEKCLYAEETDGSHCYECVKGESKFEQEPCDTISYNDDFATALEKISKYEDRKTERMENALNHIRTAVDVDEWAVKEVERVFENYDEMRMMLAETEYAKEHETCEGCTHPCIMYEPKMKACERKHECEEAVGRQASLNTIESMYQKCDGDLQTFHDLLVDCFEVLPSVQPKAKTGHWIEMKRGYLETPSYECSECHEQQFVETCMGKPIWEYCPMCGKRMVDE